MKSLNVESVMRRKTKLVIQMYLYVLSVVSKMTWADMKRTLVSLKKPNAAEFKRIVVVCAVGMLCLGVIGFVVMVLFWALNTPGGWIYG
jgi:protein translocase SEC61 complex gamma subunit